MRQYLGIYNEALAGMRDINYLIAIDTRATWVRQPHAWATTNSSGSCIDS